MAIQGVRFLIEEGLKKCALCGKYEELDDNNWCAVCAELMSWEAEFDRDDDLGFTDEYYGVDRHWDYDPLDDYGDYDYFDDYDDPVDQYELDLEARSRDEYLDSLLY